MALIPRPFQRFIGAENVLIALHAVKRSIEIFLLLVQKEKAFRGIAKLQYMLYDR